MDLRITSVARIAACRRMLRFTCLVVAAASLTAQGPPAQPPSFTAETAPETLVYRFFLGELNAVERSAEQFAAQGRDAGALRGRFQRLTGLDDADYQTLLIVAAALEEAQQASSREAAELMKGAATREERQRLMPLLARLSADVESAERRAMEELRLRLGPAKFAEMDRHIREHVAPNMKLMPPGPGAQGSPSGGQR